MVFTRQEQTILLRPMKMEVGTQTELPQKQAMTQTTSCREHLSLSLVAEDCTRCGQVNFLINWAAQLQGEVKKSQDEVKRLRNIRKYENEIDLWSQALPALMKSQGHPSLREDQQVWVAQEAAYPMPSLSPRK